MDSSSIALAISNYLENFLEPFVSFLGFLFLGAGYEIFGKIYKIDIFGIPFIVFWLIIGGLFFTLKLRFVNIRLFKHGIDVALGKYHDESAPGKVSQRQALFTAIAATVGLGNIAGVAIAVSIGGPGAVIWMMLAAFLGMSMKFAEVSLGQKYRELKGDNLFAGAFYYLEKGLKEQGFAKLGKFLGVFAAVACIGGAIGAGLMFQANQSVAIIADSFGLGSFAKLILVISIVCVIGVILIGGITRIAQIAEKIVPFMAVVYIVSCMIVLVVNYTGVLDAIVTMFSSAFVGDAVYGGVIGAIIQGFKRAAFSNEAGFGSAPIAHAAAKTKEPIREGSIAILEPFIDTIIICFMTGIVITVTGAYTGADVSNGVLMTKNAFATVSPWFPYILSFAVFLFAFSTMLTYSYYGQQAWLYLSKGKYIHLCHIIFLIAIFIGGLINLGIVIDLADILFLSMAIPNLIGMYIMSGAIKADMEEYVAKLKIGKFEYLVKKNAKKL
jgi:AGCS family alanine or glycine:cation symporter